MRIYYKLFVLLIISLPFLVVRSDNIQSNINLISEYPCDEFSYKIIRLKPFDQALGISTHFIIPGSCKVSINILDTALNKVYEFESKELARGKYLVNWMFKDNQGKIISPGYYYLDLTAESISSKFNNIYSCRQWFLAVPDE
ncbi:MAG: hypothetical protein GY865_03940 [candidate division Zixibacteria bacterium]|nr:hypothetical protein [candidate division Zixibacteria bacterium]